MGAHITISLLPEMSGGRKEGKKNWDTKVDKEHSGPKIRKTKNA